MINIGYKRDGTPCAFTNVHVFVSMQAAACPSYKRAEEAASKGTKLRLSGASQEQIAPLVKEYNDAMDAARRENRAFLAEHDDGLDPFGVPNLWYPVKG